MFDGKIERELLDGEPWLVRQPCKLPYYLQLLVDQEIERKDIWELEEHNISTLNPKQNNSQTTNYFEPDTNSV
jgi:hypothetical protein